MRDQFPKQGESLVLIKQAKTDMKDLKVSKRIIENGEVQEKAFAESMSWYLENFTPLETIYEIMGSGWDDDEKLLFFREITFNSTIKFKNK